MAQGQLLVEKLVGIAIRGVGGECTLTLLNASNLSPELAQQIRTDLESLDSNVTVADALNHGERYFFLDTMLRLTGRLDEFPLNFSGPGVSNAVGQAPKS